MQPNVQMDVGLQRIIEITVPPPTDHRSAHRRDEAAIEAALNGAVLYPDGEVDRAATRCAGNDRAAALADEW
jgi:hypothetical protein